MEDYEAAEGRWKDRLVSAKAMGINTACVASSCRVGDEQMQAVEKVRSMIDCYSAWPVYAVFTCASCSCTNVRGGLLISMEMARCSQVGLSRLNFQNSLLQAEESLKTLRTVATELREVSLATAVGTSTLNQLATFTPLQRMHSQSTTHRCRFALC
jgi:hypothetical protein